MLATQKREGHHDDVYLGRNSRCHPDLPGGTSHPSCTTAPPLAAALNDAPEEKNNTGTPRLEEHHCPSSRP